MGRFVNNRVVRSQRARAGDRFAVTMVELIIVVMVMSIMAAVAAPSFLESLVHHRVESAARRVKADLELIQHTARLTSTTQSASFTSTGYTLSAAAGGLDDPSASYAVDLTAAPFELGKVTASFGAAQTISFDGYGMPSSGGTVVLTSQQQARTVIVDGVTGQISIMTNSGPVSMPAVEAP
jgi:Tfp pilus assembly protein FimT